MIRHLPDPGTSIAFLLLLAVVTLSPLPFGSVLPRERLLLQMAAFVALAALLVSRGLASRQVSDGWADRARPAVAIAMIGAFGLLQSLVGTGMAALSLAPTVSRSVALFWLAIAALLATAVAVSRERRLRRCLGLGLLATALFEIVYGIDHWFRRSPEMWGRSIAGGFERLRGTYVNPDHFALFLIVLLAAGFALVAWSMRRARWVSLERRLLYIALPWSVFVMIFVALAFTGSRAGLIGALMTLLVQGVLLAASERSWKAGLLGFGAILIGLASLLYFGWQRGMQRWLETSAYEVAWNTRFEVYRDSFELWTRFPWTGTGLGTFRQAFPLVQAQELDLAWFHAHSDVLELLVTTGIVGFTIATWGLLMLVRRLWHALRHGRRSEDRAMALTAWGTLAGVLTHSLVDFGLTLPANAVLVSVVMGLGCGVKTAEVKTAEVKKVGVKKVGVKTAGRAPDSKTGSGPE